MEICRSAQIFWLELNGKKRSNVGHLSKTSLCWPVLIFFYWQSCPGVQTCTGWLVPVVLSQLSCPVPAVLSRLSYPAVQLRLTCPGSHVPADLSRMTCLCSPAPDVLSRLSCPFCPIRLSSPPAVLLWLTCPGWLVSALLPQLSCPYCPVPGVLPWRVFFLLKILFISFNKDK